jgi:hypothetical protein
MDLSYHLLLIVDRAAILRFETRGDSLLSALYSILAQPGCPGHRVYIPK